MERRLLIVVFLLFSLLLSGCMYSRSPYLNNNLSNEGWQSNIDTSSSAWVRDADVWFMKGDPKPATFKAPAGAVVGTMEIKVPTFDRIVTDGQFKVEVFGRDDQPSVFMHGLTKDMEHVNVTALGKTLYLKQTDCADCSIKQVVIRIGAKRLAQIEQRGSGSLEVIQLHSPGLKIISKGTGHVYFKGATNVSAIENYGSGKIVAIEVEAPELQINSYGSGGVYVSGKVGVDNICHKGSGDISIIGANSNHLIIDASGSGKISINGIVNLQQLKASNDICVFVNCVRSYDLSVATMNKAIVGLAGDAKHMTLDAAGNSVIYTQSLLAHTVYARANDASHINLSGGSRVFASATDNASIYYFGRPEALTQNTSGGGVIIPVSRYSASAYYYNTSPRRTVTYHYKDAVKVKKNSSHAKYQWVDGKLVKTAK